jgi:hypothetical protein
MHQLLGIYIISHDLLRHKKIEHRRQDGVFTFPLTCSGGQVAKDIWSAGSVTRSISHIASFGCGENL